MTTGTSVQAGPDTPVRTADWRARAAAFLSVRNIAVIYVWIAIIVILGAIKPDYFLTEVTFHRIFNEYAIAGLAGVSIVLPLAARMFDLSIGSIIGFAGIMSAWLLGHTALPVPVVILVVLACGAGLGLVNGFVVVYMKVDSFIGTLATGSIIAAVTLGVSGGAILTDGITADFTSFATANIAGIQMPFWYLLIIVVVLGLILEKTVFGRHTYATGFNAGNAELIGVNVGRTRLLALVGSGIIASLAGIVLCARIGSADPGSGSAYLIPAFSAAFLGATQFRSGRFNPWGTLVAVLMLGTGSVGLLLLGTPQWAPQIFQGAVLIIAVGLTVRQGRRSGAG